MQFSRNAVDKLRYAVRETEKRRRIPNDMNVWPQMLPLPPIVTVLITGDIDVNTGLYTGVVTEPNNDNTTWLLGNGSIKIRPANVGDIFIVGRRYPARPSYTYQGTGTDNEVFTAYCMGIGDIINIGTGTQGTAQTGTGTVPWYNVDHSFIVLENNIIYIDNSSTNYFNSTITNVNTTNTYNNSTIIYGPNTQITFNTILPIIVDQTFIWNLANNVNFVINGNLNNNFIVNIPFNVNNNLNINNNFFALMNVIPPVNAIQNPLALPGPGMFFRMKVNMPNAPILGLAPKAKNNPNRMLGIINAGPQRAKWFHRWADDPQYNVKCPDGTSYYQSINELLFLYADGSAEEWVMSAHRELQEQIGTGTGTGSSGGITDPPPCGTGEVYTFSISGTTDMDGNYTLTYVSDQVWLGEGGDNGVATLDNSSSPTTLSVQFGFFLPPKTATYECFNFSCSNGGLFELVSQTGESETWPETIQVNNP